ncbi:hypothetical protein [Halosimplex amylolyticum]|uniref:hypothetical protein n=1 Tax=Halosimplex amylolyticum TaxID=3396616 RepID=UPI003F574A5B
MERLSELRTQGPVALRAARVVLSAPQVLAYPVVAALIGLVMPFVLGGTLFLIDIRLVWLAAPGYIVGFGAVYAALMVAYCYELDALFSGRSPAPGSGLRRAFGRARIVLLGGVAISVVGMLAESGFDSVPFGEWIGATSRWGIRVASVFAFPAIATTDGSLRETVAEIQTTAERQWGSALVATVGTSAIGVVVFWSTMISSIALAIAAALGVFAVEIPPLGGYTLSVVLPVVGLVVALSVQFTVDGVVKTALYRYATDGELPPAIDGDADALLAGSSDQTSEAARDPVAVDD